MIGNAHKGEVDRASVAHVGKGGKCAVGGSKIVRMRGLTWVEGRLGRYIEGEGSISTRLDPCRREDIALDRGQGEA